VSGEWLHEGTKSTKGHRRRQAVGHHVEHLRQSRRPDQRDRANARRACLHVVPVVHAVVVTSGSGERGAHVRDRPRWHGPRGEPGRRFFPFANGTWERGTPISDDRSSWGTGAALTPALERIAAITDRRSLARAHGTRE